MTTFTRIICIDFDGVIHSYTSGWQGIDIIPDPPVPGVLDWLQNLIDVEGFKPVIYSSRSKTPEGIAAMRGWFLDWGFTPVADLEFPTQKPPAYLTIDDRAICFTGVPPTVAEMTQFQPWYKRTTE